jgi:2-polyprenyl-6-methoxyphenol hydroxylase-like FAD-dependent oxidoreductase
MTSISAADGSVVVAGGGIGGLATAIGLRAAGLKVIVLERAKEFGEIGAGIQLAPNGFNALKTLGVVERALRNAVYIDRLVMMDGVSGDQVAEISVGAPFRARFGNPYAVIHRADLHAALLDRCRSDPGVALHAGTEVEGFEQDDSHVEVRTRDGRRFTAAGMIGADGVRSRIRQAIVGDGALKISGHVCYRSVLPTAEMPDALRLNAAVLWAGPRTHFIHYPLRDWKFFNIVATFHSSNGAADLLDEPGNRDELLAHFHHLPAPPLSVLEKSVGWRRWVLGDRDPVASWTMGRVTLLGDAAHPTYQYFAQGACMALEDAVCLMHEVRGCADHLPMAFQRYQEKRITRTARIVLSSRALGKYWYHAEGVERLVRNDMLRARTEEDSYRGLDWIYGYGRTP